MKPEQTDSGFFLFRNANILNSQNKSRRVLPSISKTFKIKKKKKKKKKKNEVVPKTYTPSRSIINIIYATLRIYALMYNKTQH